MGGEHVLSRGHVGQVSKCDSSAAVNSIHFYSVITDSVTSFSELGGVGRCRVERDYQSNYAWGR